MDHRTLSMLRREHPAWRLLAADHAPLVVSFLYQSFIRPNVRTQAQQDLTSRLEDHFYHLRQQMGDDAFPRPALHYLDDWASDGRGWLRKYYPADSDEPHYDVTSGGGQRHGHHRRRTQAGAFVDRWVCPT